MKGAVKRAVAFGMLGAFLGAAGSGCAAQPTSTPSSTSTPTATPTPVELPTLGAYLDDTPSETPRPTRIPTAATSPLFVDGPAHRIYASGPLSGTGAARLAVYDTRDGRLVAAAPLAVDERLLDIDRAGRRLYMYRAAEGVRLLDADTLGEVGRVGLPTPDAAEEAAIGITPWPRLRQWPLVHPVTHQLVTFDGMTVRMHDGVSGAVDSAFDVPLDGDVVGPIKNASFSADGRILYVAVADASLAPWDGQTGAILAGIDMGSRHVIERRNLRATVTGWLAWGDSVLIEGTVDKLVGRWHILWVGGHERRRLVGANWSWRWSGVDTRRQRLLGSLTLHGSAVDVGLWATLADPATLDLAYLTPVLRDQPFVDGGDWNDPPQTVYDDATDQYFRRSVDDRQLVHVSASDVAPGAPPADVPAPHQTVRALSAVLPAPNTGGSPIAFTGILTTTPRAGTPTPMSSYGEFHEAILRAGDPVWRVNEPAGAPDWPDSVVAAPASAAATEGAAGWSGATNGATLFGVIEGAGVFHSTDVGRSWQPAGSSVDALRVRDIDVSPDYARDRTLFATSFSDVPYADGDDDPTATAWRSRDGGERWEPIERMAALAVSPAFGVDRTIMAFSQLGGQFFVSTDAGDHWQTRGSLPSRAEDADSHVTADETWIVPAAGGQPRIVLTMATTGTRAGGGAHWPESGLQLYRSTDDGATWKLVWSPQVHGDPMDDVHGDPELLGAIGGTVVLRASTNRSGALLSSDGGLTWRERWVADAPVAVPLAVTPNGVVVGAGRRYGPGREGVWTVGLDEFVDRAPTGR